MQSKEISPCNWDKEPVLNSFIQLENYLLLAKLTEEVEYCKLISDFCCFFYQ